MKYHVFKFNCFTCSYVLFYCLCRGRERGVKEERLGSCVGGKGEMG